MYFKLGLKNVQRSMRDYAVYFLTLTFGVCIFYIFNSIESQQAMLLISESQRDILQLLNQVMGYVSVFVSFILGFLILYANKFLIKRRKKELGIYMLLGMEKRQISRVLLQETLLIGLFSLAAGLGLGILLSQGLSILTANLLAVDMTEFQFVFSQGALFKTLLYFGLIFAIAAIFNTISISKYKLIDLLQAAKKNEVLRVRNLALSVALFVLSVLSLGAAYYFIEINGMMTIDLTFGAAIALGILGTLLFFMSLSGFLLRAFQGNKKVYLKGLNMFVLRQLNSKINTTFVSMTVICLMLLMMIGTFSVGMGLGSIFNSELTAATPYSCSLSQSQEEGALQPPLAEQLRNKGMDLETEAAGYAEFIYYEAPVTYMEIIRDNGDMLANQFSLERMSKMPLPVIALSDYNALLALQGREPQSLPEGQFAVLCNFDAMLPVVRLYCDSQPTLSLGGQTLSLGVAEPLDAQLQISNMKSEVGALVGPDSAVEGLTPSMRGIAIQLPEGADQAFLDHMKAIDWTEEEEEVHPIFGNTRLDIFEASRGMTAIISYLVIYLGIVFLITSAAVLALQQLSEAADNLERYRLLRRIGAEPRMINGALFTQILIYFMVPLSLAIVHAAVGLHVANRAIASIGNVNIWSAILATAGFVLVVYGGYFLATYFASRSMIAGRD